MVSVSFEKEPTEETNSALKEYLSLNQGFKGHFARSHVEIKVTQSLFLHSILL